MQVGHYRMFSPGRAVRPWDELPMEVVESLEVFRESGCGPWGDAGGPGDFEGLFQS